MKEDLAGEYREAIDEFCGLMISVKALNSPDDPDVALRVEEARRRCELAHLSLFGADAA